MDREKSINAHSLRPARTQQILYTLTHRIDDYAITLQQFYCATFAIATFRKFRTDFKQYFYLRLDDSVGGVNNS